MGKHQLNCIAAWFWAVSLLVPGWQPMAAQKPAGSAPQAPSPSATPQDQAARIDQMLKECDGLLKEARYDDLAHKAEEAATLSRAMNDKNRLAHALTWLGTAHFYRGRNKEARQVLKEVAIVVNEAGDRKYQAQTLNNIGSVLRTLGQYEEALDCLHRALALQREFGDRAASLYPLRNIGVLYADLGDYEKAEPFLQETLQLSRELKNKGWEEAALNTLADLEIRRSNFQSARRYLEQALAIDPEVNYVALRYEVLANMGRVYSELGDPRRALEVYQQPLDLARQAGDHYSEAIIISFISQSQRSLGQLSESLDSLKRARALLRQTGDFPEREWSINLYIARVQRAVGHSDEALVSYREALANIERLRASAVPTETSRASVIASRRDVFVETVDLLFTLKREAEALEVADASRARAFLDLLAESRIDVRDELTEEQRYREDHLFNRLSAIQKELGKEGVPAEREQQLKGDLVKAENDLEAFRLELHRTNPRYASVQYSKPLGVDRIQRELLEADTALIEYMLGEKQSFAWAVTQEKLTVAVLPPRQQIEKQLTAYRQALTKKVSALTLHPALAEYQHQSQQLYQVLLHPLEDALSSSQKLIIVPDGALAYLPFETLIGGQGSAVRDQRSQRREIRNPQSAIRNPNVQRPHYLLERFAITYAPSASALAAVKGQIKEPAFRPKVLLAFGDPIYSRGIKSGDERSARPDSTASSLSFYTERGFDFARLPYTRAEVTSISSLYAEPQRQVYLGPQAQEQRVKTEKLDEYRYIHFATHGVINEDKPARSGLVLSLDDTSKEDGVLQMSEIMRLKLNADLVTLSACSTGLGKLLDGEGLIGLTRAFFYAGARSLVVSLWNVNDLATAELMKAFYQNLKRGLSKDEALRQAKRALLKGSQRVWQHPYFWAPFVLVGERK